MANLILDQPRIWGQVIGESVRRTARNISPRRLVTGWSSTSAKELLLAPQDMRTADPILANEFFHGKYSFCGHTIETNGASVFDIVCEHEGWLRELHSFSWLRHLSKAESAIASQLAQSLVKDWISKATVRAHPQSWETEIASMRLISWLCHSVMLVENADYESYRRLLKSISSHTQFIKSNVETVPEGMGRLTCRIALAYAGICVDSNRNNAQGDFDALGKSLARQILKDGGHVSRNPVLLPLILTYLLPLRQAFEKSGKTPPAEMLTAIDRIMPALRFFRHRDGTLARFNGMGASEQDLLAVLLRYDDAMGEPTREAVHSGYQRLNAGATTLIMDTGNSPRGEHSAQAHAGTLSFEMSALNHSFIVNCGSPVGASTPREKQLAALARSTAAHSTAVLHDTSSCRFHDGGMIGQFLSNRIIAGPSKTSVQRNVMDNVDQVAARHDGYLQQFGIWHERLLQLSKDGNVLIGRDRFFAHGGKAPIHLSRDDCVLRFHLHPAVKTQVSAQGTILLRTCENQVWEFSCSGGDVALDESVFFASARGMEKTSQITVALELSKLAQVSWQFVQTLGTRAQ